MAANTTEGGHARALAGLTNLEAEVRQLADNTRGHLGDLESSVSNLQPPGNDLQSHLQGVEVALCQSMEQLAQVQHAQNPKHRPLC